MKIELSLLDVQSILDALEHQQRTAAIVSHSLKAQVDAILQQPQEKPEPTNTPEPLNS